MESPLFAHSIAAVDNETVWVEKKQRSRRTAKHAVSNRHIVGKRTTQALFKTAKNHTRLYVDHEYRDHAHDFDTDLLSFEQEGGNGESKRTNCELFPFKLHKVLTDAGRNGWDHVISWASHGRCFTIHQPKEFVSQIIPRYFHQSKLTSFQRQLNLYRFNRLTCGRDKGSYYNEYFLRGKPSLCKHMERVKVKGTGIKASGNPGQEPDFYSLPPVPVTYIERILPLASMPANDGIKGSTVAEAAAITQMASTEPTLSDDESTFDERIADLFAYQDAFDHPAAATTDNISFVCPPTLMLSSVMFSW